MFIDFSYQKFTWSSACKDITKLGIIPIYCNDDLDSKDIHRYCHIISHGKNRLSGLMIPKSCNHCDLTFITVEDIRQVANMIFISKNMESIINIFIMIKND